MSHKTPWASTARYRESFTFIIIIIISSSSSSSSNFLELNIVRCSVYVFLLALRNLVGLLGVMKIRFLKQYVKVV
jgi:hypothetical protein